MCKKKWWRFVFSSALVLWSIYGGGALSRIPVAFGSELDDLKWQLEQMEEVFRKQQEKMEEVLKKQQQEIRALKSRLNTISDQNATASTGKLALGRSERNKKEEKGGNDAVQSKKLEKTVTVQQEQIQAINNRLNVTNANVEEIMKSGVASKEPNDMRVYWKEGLHFDSYDGAFRLKLEGRIQQDWGWLTEDKEIRENIGDQVDGTEFRRVRLYLSGTIYENIGFKIEHDFAGGDSTFKDVYAELKNIPVVGNFKAGHFKEPFSLEQQDTSNIITFMERSLADAFVPARNTGFSIYNDHMDGRMTWRTGVFRNAGEFGDSQGGPSTEGSYSFSARLTGLPWYKEGGRKFLHAGMGYSYQNAFENKFEFESRPEIHLADEFVGTGEFEAESANLFGPELSLVRGPFSFQTEYIYADIDRGSGGPDLQFSGYYFYGSYFITGENRRYQTDIGEFDNVRPNKNFKWGEGIGAIELAARYSAIDLADEDINGGRLSNITIGANWYLNPNMRVMLNYVHANADISGEDDANADLVGLRFNIFF